MNNVKSNIEYQILFVPLTKACNYHCRYCLAVPRASWELPTKEYLNNINFEKYNTINLTGGEPSLAKKELYYALKIIGKEKKVFIQTNGSNFNIIDMLRLKKYNIFFSVSLPASNPYTFYYITKNRKFNKSLRKIKLINLFFPNKISIKWVLTKQSLSESQEYINLLKKLKINNVSLGMVLNNGARNDDYKNYMPDLRKVLSLLNNLRSNGIKAYPLQFPQCVVGDYKQSIQSAKRTDCITYELQTKMVSPYYKSTEIPINFYGSMHTEKCLDCLYFKKQACMGFPADYIRIFGTEHQKPFIKTDLEKKYDELSKKLKELLAPYDLCGFKSSENCKGNLAALKSNPTFNSLDTTPRCCRDKRYENIYSSDYCEYSDNENKKCKKHSLGCDFWFCPEVKIPQEILSQFNELKTEAENLGFLQIRKNLQEILNI